MDVMLLLLALAGAGLGGSALLVRAGLDDFEAWCGGRVMGLILVAMPAWWAGVVGLRQWQALGVAVLLMVAVAGMVGTWRRRAWRQIAAAETVFLAAAVVVLFLRLDHPQIAYQEKPMDLGIFASLLRSEGFPPPDMWLAGWTLPYYYWGALLWIVPIAASGLKLELAYNLVVALAGGVFAATMWAVGRRLGGGHRSGLLVAFFALLAGTPDALRQLLRGTTLPAVDIWHSSRQIADTITEFPLFTFWLGDLHPHLLSMPVAALAVLVALEAGREHPGALQTAILALLFGVCWAANPWSMPPVLASIGLLLLAGPRRWYWPVREGRRRWLMAGAVAIGGWLLTAPFHLGFQPFFEGIRRVSAWTAPHELLLYGGCLLVPAILAAWGLLRSQVGAETAAGRTAALAVAAAALVVAAASGRPTLVLLGVGAGVTAVSVLTARQDPGRPALALAALGLFLFAVPEVVYVADGYGDALHRMNTVFKAYIQGWIYLAAALPVLLQRAVGRRRLRLALGAALTVVALVHPLSLALRVAKADELGLDGLRWLSPGDRAIVDVLRRQPRGSVVIEAVGGAYTEYGRLSAASGVPAYLGWENHEMVWRGNEILDETSRRRQLVQALYGSADPVEVRRLAAEAGADLIAFGSLERQDFGEESLAALAAAGEVLVDRDGALLVRVAEPPRAAGGDAQ